MKDVPLTDVIQNAYDHAIEVVRTEKSVINTTQDVCHLAYSFALFDLYQGHKKHHYDIPIKKLYKLFDSGAIDENNTYSAFAYCYLRVFVREKVIKEKTFQAQFEFENKKHAK